MKVRSGFVSNSSSSSFLIPINALTESQILMIQDYINVTENWCKYHKEDNLYPEGWDITVNEKCVYGWTTMDNFDMSFFLNVIVGVNKYIHWGDDYTDNNIDLDALNREILQEERKEKLDNIENYGYILRNKINKNYEN